MFLSSDLHKPVWMYDLCCQKVYLETSGELSPLVLIGVVILVVVGGQYLSVLTTL